MNQQLHFMMCPTLVRILVLLLAGLPLPSIAQSLDVKISTLAPGSSLTLTWNASPNHLATDWIGLFSLEESRSQPIGRWFHILDLTGGTVETRAPLTPGRYEYRYLDSDGQIVHARSPLITVDSELADFDLVTTVINEPNSVDKRLRIEWNVPAGRPPWDWVGLFSADGDNDESTVIEWIFTEGQSSGSYETRELIGDGHYQFRYLLNNGTSIVALGELVTVATNPGSIPSNSASSVPAVTNESDDDSSTTDSGAAEIDLPNDPNVPASADSPGISSPGLISEAEGDQSGSGATSTANGANSTATASAGSPTGDRTTAPESTETPPVESSSEQPNGASSPAEPEEVGTPLADISESGYGVFRSDGVGGFIEHTDTVSERRTCTLTYGGLCSRTQKTLAEDNTRLLFGVFGTRYEAELAYCNNLNEDSLRYTLGVVRGYLGGQYMSLGNGPTACPPAPESTPLQGTGSSQAADEASGQRLTALSVEVVDANPLFVTSDCEAGTNTSALDWTDYADIADLTCQRAGVVADGVSHLVIRAVYAQPGEVVCDIPTGPVDGFCAPILWKQSDDLPRRSVLKIETTEYQDQHMAYFKYIPPSQLAETEIQQVIKFTLDYSPTSRSSDEAIPTYTRQLLLRRPPVVLVHGTFSNPDTAFLQPHSVEPRLPNRGSVSLYEYLDQRGFDVFLTNYVDSNGSNDTPEGLERSTFMGNRLTVWENPGGLRDAIHTTRIRYNIAATNADVVGHSFGGLLPRIYASAHYRATSDEHDYRRPANFEQGDIRRLITLCTPHFGSDLAEILRHLDSEAALSSAEKPLLENPVETAALLLAQKFGGAQFKGAIVDQLPNSPALKDIGATRIPSHAIICQLSPAEMYRYSGEYLKLFFAITELFRLHPAGVETYFESVNKTTDGLRLREHIAFTPWRVRLDVGDPVNGIEGIKNDTTVMINMVRAAIFGNTPNDGTVRAESQQGGLSLLRFTTVVDDVIHSYAPRYEEVQRKIHSLLTSEDHLFFRDGFPEAGQTVYDRDLDRRPLAPRENENVAASGIVRSHAEIIREVAAARDIIIMARPVNLDSTALIRDNQGTKGMPIKGKSANWGPQRAYVARQQRFSKLWNTTTADKRAFEINKFNAQVEQSLQGERPAVIALPLTVTISDQRYNVYTSAPPPGAAGSPLGDTGDATQEIVLILVDEQGNESEERLDWRTAGSSFSADNAPTTPSTVTEPLYPLEVLADPVTGKYLTADYDLLAVGTRTPKQEVGPFHPETGGVTPREQNLIGALNAAVRNTGYSGGNVVHHGPETNYVGSPGVDYPITIFEPTGLIWSISPTQDEIDSQQKDAAMKYYFSLRMREGWHFRINPVWGWEYYCDYSDESGFDPRDPPATEALDVLPNASGKTRSELKPADYDWKPEPRRECPVSNAVDE